MLVASRAEAWIETLIPVDQVDTVSVASRAEAWIETAAHKTPTTPSGSPPARRRGLKRHQDANSFWPNKSPPARRRGLKQRNAHAIGRRDSRLPRGGVD